MSHTSICELYHKRRTLMCDNAHFYLQKAPENEIFVLGKPFLVGTNDKLRRKICLRHRKSESNNE